MNLVKRIFKTLSSVDKRPDEDRIVGQSSDVDTLIKILSALPKAGVQLSCDNIEAVAVKMTDRFELLYGSYSKPEAKERMKSELISFLEANT